jgi:purine-binding chemotaxis protein CheW
MSDSRQTLDRNATDSRAPAAQEFLAFLVAATHYALPIAAVREVVLLPAVTEVPRSPEHVLGVIKVRGQVTTLIDLRKLLRLPQVVPTPTARVILVAPGSEVLGLLVDAVWQVHRLTQDEIEPASVLGAEAPAYLAGIGRPKAPSVLPGGFRGTAVVGTLAGLLLLLDPDRLLRTK